jgi:hypothetical protein
MTIDWSNPTVQAAAVALVGVFVAGVFVVAGALVGGRISARAARGAAETVAAAAKDTRQEKRQDHRDDIQRDNLMALQEVLTEWMNAVTRVHWMDMDLFHTTGVRTAASAPENLEARALLARLKYLTERMRSDALRTRFDHIRIGAMTIELATNALDLQKAWQTLGLEVDKWGRELGAELRQSL